MKYFILILSLICSTSTFAAPKANLWEYWDKSNAQNTQTISHQKWQQFLDNNLIEKGEETLIVYGKVSKSDKQSLQSYITGLAKLDPRTYNQPEQYAYWVNLYNALTINLVLDHYPIESITKLGHFFSFGPWEDKIVTVTGKPLTLNDIEHRILRPIWQDPRTHYAVNCASLGCPNLQPVALNATNQEMLLEQAAGSYINSKKGVHITQSQQTLSSIYKWFAEDFGTQEALIKHLKKYRPNLDIDINNIKYDYDWALNDLKIE